MSIFVLKLIYFQHHHHWPDREEHWQYMGLCNTWDRDLPAQFSNRQGFDGRLALFQWMDDPWLNVNLSNHLQSTGFWTFLTQHIVTKCVLLKYILNDSRWSRCNKCLPMPLLIIDKGCNFKRGSTKCKILNQFSKILGQDWVNYLSKL